MKHLYYKELGARVAVCDASMVDDDTWEINRINVPAQSRGFGHASELLRRVTRDADDEGVVLVLYVYPSGGLDFDQLAKWYERHGFRWTSQDEGAMRRDPN